jgi:tetratricopeptide (TPR) repeat protein
MSGRSRDSSNGGSRFGRLDRVRVRLLLTVAAVALSASAYACASGDIQDVQREVEGKGAVIPRPPPSANAGLTGRVGLIVATNSDTWQKLLNAPQGPGVAVLYSQEGAPAAAAGIKRGDVITKVDGRPSNNAERAVVQLRARPNENRSITLAGGRSVTVQAKVPGQIDLHAIYTGMIGRAPTEAVNYFLRAQSPGTYDQAKADTDKAIELAPSFVEAISLRAETQWNKASNDKSLEASKVEELRDSAISDWDLAIKLDPNNGRVLVSRAQALALRGNASSAKRDADKAISLDTTFPGAHYALAVADVWLGRYKQAAEPARTAIDLNPYDVRYYRTLAGIFMRLGQRSDAEKTVNAILPLVDDDATKESLRAVLSNTTDNP